MCLKLTNLDIKTTFICHQIYCFVKVKFLMIYYDITVDDNLKEIMRIQGLV